jgi:hypothetical protein
MTSCSPTKRVFFFPDATPMGSETRTFEVVLGEGVLDEDWEPG